MNDNPITIAFNFLSVAVFIFMFFSPIFVSFIAAIYNLVKCLRSEKDSKDRTKYKKRIKVALIAFVIALALYFGFFYWLSINWHM